MSTPSEEAAKLRKYLLWGLIAFAVTNHIVRELTFRVSPPPEEGWNSFPEAVDSNLVYTLDGWRKELGSEVTSWTGECSEQYVKYCKKGISGIKIILGLH